MKDVGRFFVLWDMVPKTDLASRPSEEMYHLALDMAIQAKSAKLTCAVLEEFITARVLPSPDLAEKLAKAGRHVTQIHLLVGRLVTMNRETIKLDAERETAMLQTRMDEREL